MPSATDARAPADVVDRLYGGGLDEFVSARAAAAKALRREGRRGEAAAVEALRKPTVAAAAVNRVVRAEPKLLGALLAAGDRLREVQLAAGSGRDLRAAVDDETRALDALVRTAAKAAGGEATLTKVRETLHAAALDPAVAEDVRAGVLVKEARAVGFPLGVSVPPGRVRAPRTPAKAAGASRPLTEPTGAAGSRAEVAAARRRQSAEADAARAKEELAAAVAELADAKDALAAAERALKQATARERTARRAHDTATARAEEAAARLAEADG
jgi:hypothetical protein